MEGPRREETRSAAPRSGEAPVQGAAMRLATATRARPSQEPGATTTIRAMTGPRFLAHTRATLRVVPGCGDGLAARLPSARLP